MADQNREGFLSPFLRRQRYKAVKPYLDGRILDVGCGSGELAELVESVAYFGVEVDDLSLKRARKDFPFHRFEKNLPELTEKFDTVVALAVIEHVPDAAVFLQNLSQYLVASPAARIVITTPHSSVDWVHKIGATLGLLSKHANEEHEDLLNRAKLEMLGIQAGLRCEVYSRFLFGVNQIVVYAKVVS